MPAEDGSPLHGVVQEPPSGAAEAAVLHVHGKGGNFYSGPPRVLPPLIAPDRFVHLSLNLRCHDLAYSRLGDAAGIAPGPGAAYGGMWERLDEGAADLDAGVRWLHDHTGLPVVLVTHSAGGYFLGDYSVRRPPVAGRVFLSPLTSVRFPLSAWWPDDDQLRDVGRQAEEMVASGDGHLLIPVPSWYYAISAASLVERLHERPGRWLDGCNASDVPVLLAFGGAETRAAEWRSLFAQLTAPQKVMLELPGAGHSYDGAHRPLADAIAAFVGDVLPGFQ
ncbi:alpha/beta fold hydrolase [Modestobacter lapidis]|nr:hypothetical protein [Modestobacter lapidis]